MVARVSAPAMALFINPSKPQRNRDSPQRTSNSELVFKFDATCKCPFCSLLFDYRDYRDSQLEGPKISEELIAER